MVANDKITGIVSDVLKERLEKDVAIIRVDSEEDIDTDGEPILLVRVVYETASGKLDAAETSGLVRHLLPRLLTAQERRFPLISFIKRSEAKVLNPEAA